jgi:glycosyltransferase involved in cell wall biosynthesis
MRTAGVLLAPDEDEAFGLSVVEAMARGLPVVAAGSGAHLETVGSTPGAALFAPGDPGDAARLLRELALSEHARDEYGARLQAVQREHFTVEQQARRTDAAYQALL